MPHPVPRTTLLIALAFACIACTREATPPTPAVDVAPATTPANASVEATETAPDPATTPSTSALPAGKLATNDPVAQLANLSVDGALATEAPAVASYLQSHFNDACAKNDVLPFDNVCEHIAADADDADPSPWPDLMLGVDDGRIVTAVLFHPAQQLGGWTCEPVPGFDSIRACTTPGVSDADRAQWRTAWGTFFNAAD